MRPACLAVLSALVTLCAVYPGPAHGAAHVCDPRSYGAKADGVTKDTAAIQQAIDTCAAEGTRLRVSAAGMAGEKMEWPRVVLAGGTFVSGPLQLKSNIVFSIRKGTTLLGSPDRADYPPAQFAGKTTVMPLLGAVGQHNITISGAGTVDGNGHVWWEYVQGVKDSGVLGTDHPRPMGLVLDHSKHIMVSGITMQNAGFWQIVPYYAYDVSFRNMRVLAPKSPNTDAIDPFSSSNILIDHVFSSVAMTISRSSQERSIRPGRMRRRAISPSPTALLRMGMGFRSGRRLPGARRIFAPSVSTSKGRTRAFASRPIVTAATMSPRSASKTSRWWM